MIGILNRRFVSTYYNDFVGPGHDPTAAAYLEEADNPDNQPLQYGALFTPDKEFIVSFGFDRQGFYDAIVKAMHEHPDLVSLTPDEQAVVEKAQSHPDDLNAQIARAQLHADLLDWAQAREVLHTYLDREEGSADERARAQYYLGHFTLLDLARPNTKKARKILASIQNPPADIADDIALDLISLNTELRHDRAFYGGRKFKKGVDLDGVVQTLTDWINRAPESNRIGQMHFLLGLARARQGDLAKADASWKKHFTDYPEDRWAMLSRLHNTSYSFSPEGAKANSVRRATTSLPMNNPVMQSLMKKLREAKGQISINNGHYTIKGQSLTDEEEAALRAMMKNANSAPAPTTSDPATQSLLKKLRSGNGQVTTRDGHHFINGEQLTDKEEVALNKLMKNGTKSRKVTLTPKPK